jgi:hypothetical protein
MLQLPDMFRLKQIFPRPVIADIAETTRNELSKLRLNHKICKGQKIGITVGSRGIENLLPILQTTVDAIKSLGGEPYLIAAMGSHGGGTESGQKDLLDHLNITENRLAAKVLTCADCEIVTHTTGGLPVFIVTSALTMDGIIVVNRVKSHTSFTGIVESGLIKMLAVGLGGPKGAQQFHGFGPEALPRLLVEIGDATLENLPILGGLAIVENAYEETAMIKGIATENMIDEEEETLFYAKSLAPSLPVDNIDLLIIQEMGKDFSGTGMDTNIIGRARIHNVREPEKPCIKRIAALDLSQKSQGNATGVGLADFITKKLLDKIDCEATYFNCLTSTFVMRAAIPMSFETEEALLNAALYSLSGIALYTLRIVMIANTLFLTDCLISKGILPELADKPNMIIDKKPLELLFDSQGALLTRLPNRGFSP